MIDVRRAADRPRTAGDGRDTRHSFSYGRHYDPANVGFGRLRAHNEDLLAPGAGYGPHPHADVEIVTWVLAGTLAHTDSTGRSGLLRPGRVQVVRAGSGIGHAERNASAVEPLHLVQMWIMPDTPGGPPAYSEGKIVPGPDLTPVAGGPGAAVPLATPATALYAARPTGRVELPEAAFVHVYVARGAVALDGAGRLGAGDAARLTGGGGHLDAAAGDAELLVWAMHRVPVAAQGPTAQTGATR